MQIHHAPGQKRIAARKPPQARSNVAVAEAVERRLLLSASLVKDINSLAVGSGPSDFVDLNGVALFAATDVDHGRELWRSDGTAAGTTLVKDITPGPKNASGSNYGPIDLVNAGGTVYFSVPGSEGTAGLWKTDGTDAGTVLVAPATTLLGSPSEITAAGNRVFFVAGDYQTGDSPAVWVSDGTAAGTHRITAGMGNAPAASPSSLVALGDQVFFMAANGNGIGLWRANSSATGPTLVAPLDLAGLPGPLLATANGRVYFVANDGENPSLFVTDGINTQRITPAGVTVTTKVVAYNGSTYFTAGDASGAAIWKTDGTPAGTAPVVPVPSSHLVVAGPYLYFSGRVSTGATELFRTDGTAAGTIQLTSFPPDGTNPVPVTDLNGNLLFEVFVVRAHVGGTQLWKSDGTPAGTGLLKDIDNPSTAIANVHGVAFMGADDLTGGPELWKSDGTPGGTVLVKRINPATQSSDPRLPIVVNGELFFTAYDGSGQGIWKSDGTAAGTTLVKEFNPDLPSFGQIDLTGVGGTLYFVEEEASPTDLFQLTFTLYRSDGTTAGTVPVMPLQISRIQNDNGTGPYLDPQLTAVGDTLYFISDNFLWKTSPASSGATRVGGIPSVVSTDLVSLGNALYIDDSGFAQAQPKPSSSGPPAFRSGLSTAGNRATLAAAAFNGSVYYLASTSAQPAVYRIDGTTGAASLVKSFPGDALPFDYSDPSATSAGFYTAGGKMFFTLASGVWVSDGTAAGTRLILPHARLRVSPVELGGEVYFIAADASSIRGTQQLWKTDGTAAGTVLVKDNLADIYGPHDDPQLVLYGGLLYFTAPYQQMLWQSDGTPQGTVPVPGVPYMQIPVTNSTSILGVAGGKLLFSPSDPAHGNEPWALDTAQTGSPLVIHGTDGPDAVSVFVDSDGTLVATVNGKTTDYPLAQYEKGLTIDTGAASGTGDVLNIVGLPAVAVQVQSEGPLSVYVGGGRRGMQDVAATTLTIGAANAQQGKISLTLDDGGDTTARSVTLDSTTIGGVPYGTVTGLSAGAISYNAQQTVPPLTIYGGGGGNTFTVSHTAAGPNINLSTGEGNDTVNVLATAAGMVLNINGKSGTDTVYIGGPSQHSVQNIFGVVNVANPLGKTTLTIDDQIDTTSRAMTLDAFSAGGTTYGTLQGLAHAPINFAGANLDRVNVLGPQQAPNTLVVNNTPGGGRIYVTGLASARVLGTAPDQPLDLIRQFLIPQLTEMTVDFSTGRIGARSAVLADAEVVNIIGGSPADQFVGFQRVADGSSVSFVDDDIDRIHFSNGTLTTSLLAGRAVDFSLGPAATATFTGPNVQLGNLDIGAGSTLTLSPAPAPDAPSGLFVGGQLNVQGKLDLTDNVLDLASTTSDQVRALIKQGLGGKSGITSSAADASHNLGYAPRTGGSPGIMVRLTPIGDANLDGKVSFADLLALAQNYGKSDASWFQGDFNYDGKVDFADLLRLSQNYGKAAGLPTTATRKRTRSQ